MRGIDRVEAAWFGPAFAVTLGTVLSNLKGPRRVRAIGYHDADSPPNCTFDSGAAWLTYRLVKREIHRYVCETARLWNNNV